MIAKIIAHGPNREEARLRLVSALEETAILGLKTNRDFLIDALSRPAYVAGEATTGFIDDVYGSEGYAPPEIDAGRYAAVAALQHFASLDRSALLAPCVDSTLHNWSSAGSLTTVVQYEIGDVLRTFQVSPSGPRDFRVHEGEDVTNVAIRSIDQGKVRLTINGGTEVADYHDDGAKIWISFRDRTLELINLVSIRRMKIDAAGQGSVSAPMHGRLVDICVVTGANVQKGDRLAILEAMKMQHELVAEIDGKISRIVASAGEQIAAHDIILEIEPHVQEKIGAPAS